MEDLQLAPLTPAAILAVRERAGGSAQPRRALALLAAASPAAADALAALPLGRRDAALLRVRRMTFGNDVACVEPCPACGLQLEFGVDVARLLELDPGCDGEVSAAPLRVRAGGREWAARLPCTADVEAALARPDRRREALVEGCLLEPAAMSPELVAGFDDACAEADPLADIRFTLVCSGCGHEARALFDPAALLWSECRTTADRLLEDVHRIASTYHWPEDRILALPAGRRRFYLSRIAQGLR